MNNHEGIRSWRRFGRSIIAGSMAQELLELQGGECGEGEPCEGDQPAEVLWAVEEALRFYPKSNRKPPKQRSNMI